MLLAFPCEKSVNFPHRKGTLNFYDDKTHTKPPVFEAVLEKLNKNGMRIIIAKRQYKPLFYWIWGLLREPASRRKQEIMKGTWAFWGFETVIWAEKK